MNILALVLTVIISSIIKLPAASATVYSYGDGNTVIGYIQTYKINDSESLIEIARKFGLGYNEIVDANPDLDPFVPGAGVSVKIPTLWILPDPSLNEKIVINLSELRLYYFFKQKGERMVRTFPIGIGDEGYDTPEGNFRIIEKIVKPSWHVPESIRRKRPHLPMVLPPGPNNPLGSHALRLSSGNYLIHGTNRPWAVGRKLTHGCIRLYPEDISRLFRFVQIGVKVNIVRHPIKVGIKDNKVYIEVHKDDYKKDINYFNDAVRLLIRKNLLKSISTEKLYKALIEKSGIPVDISN